MHALPLPLDLEPPAAAGAPSSSYESMIRVITEHYQNSRFDALAVASSMGKDSTLVCALTLEAVRRLAESGQANKPVVVMTSNTGVENPLVEQMAFAELARIRKYATAHGLPVHTLVGSPNLAACWQVKVISGGAIAPVPGGSAWCSLDWKIAPLVRELKRWTAEQGIRGEILKLTGTRFSESTTRGAKMTERGESAHRFTRNQRGEAILSPIADLTADDVWELLGALRAGSLRGAWSDMEALFEVYEKSGGTSCAVVSDERLRSVNRGECSPRGGCAFCTKVDRDKALENMLIAHPELQPLYAIREWVANITFDFDRRTWIGRTIKNGYITVAPDSYAPEAMQALLRYCLTADAIERERAARFGQAPLFEIITLEHLIAIDFMWSLNGFAPAFEAHRILKDVVEDGSRYHPPELPRASRVPLPEPRYLYVGEGWEGGESDGVSYALSGLREPMMEALEADTGADVTLRSLADGRDILSVTAADALEVTLDEGDTWDWLQFMLPSFIEEAKRNNYRPSFAARRYLQSGVVRCAASSLGKVDQMLRRVAFREANGLTRGDDLASLMSRTISKQEFIANTQPTGRPDGSPGGNTTSLLI